MQNESGVTDTKQCSRCDRDLPVDAFYVRKTRTSGYSCHCKKCTCEYARDYGSKNKKRRNKSAKRRYHANSSKQKARAKTWRENNAERRRNAYLKRRFGITLADYNMMLENQEHRCAGCRREFSAALIPAVDHCHSTGNVRGLLCSFCNRGIGLMYDDPSTLLRLIDYLKRGSSTVSPQTQP